jgi:predicted aspartyl protease
LHKPVALTIKANKGVLKSPLNIHVPNTNQKHSINGIWDTGATGTTITNAVVNKLGLKPTGAVQVNTANGTALQNTYTIDVSLPNNVLIQGITCTEVSGLVGGCDALIGMDIITLGDFSITNHNGMTCMSFRVPSSHEIDYVKNPTFGVTPIKNLGAPSPGVVAKKNLYPGAGRNKPCPCGSRKNYKNCCGTALK